MGGDGLFIDFLVEVIDPETEICDPNYYKIRGVINDCKPFQKKL